MRDLIIISEYPISSDLISDSIKEACKDLIVLNDDHSSLYMKTNDDGFELEFSPNDKLSDPMSMMDDTVDKIPLADAYLTNLHFSSLSAAKKVIKTMIGKFGKMWVESDEGDEWLGTAEEFIENYSFTFNGKAYK